MFNPSERGTFGSGIYFGDRHCAAEYADMRLGDLVTAQITLNNLYRYTADFDPIVDLVSPAVALIHELFSPQQALALIKQSMETDAHFGSEIEKRLTESPRIS